MKQIDMPRHIDDQPQYLFWEMDEVMIVVAMCAIGIAASALLTMLVCGIIASYFLRRNKVASLPGLTIHASYWVGLVALSPRFPNGSVREWVA